MTEQAASAGKGKAHRAEFAEKAVPRSEGEPVLRGRDAVEEFEEPVGAALREGEGHGNGVDNPAEDFLDSVPVGVALTELLHGDRFLPVDRVVGVERTEDVVDGSHKDAAKLIEAAWAALAGGKEIVNKDVDGAEDPLAMWKEWVACHGRR